MRIPRRIIPKVERKQFDFGIVRIVIVTPLRLRLLRRLLPLLLLLLVLLLLTSVMLIVVPFISASPPGLLRLLLARNTTEI